jgi:hypothetical protein
MGQGTQRGEGEEGDWAKESRGIVRVRLEGMDVSTRVERRLSSFLMVSTLNTSTHWR